MNIEQRIQSAKRSIANYEQRIRRLELGLDLPMIGELFGNRMLLKRKQRQLHALEVTQTIKRRAAVEA